ncbi:MAG TPA: PEP-CTERM sorting domain-containing protein [Verrucomicrobiales bacterium]|jgi:subtilisin-like proprotein convertase family protein|nr:PEP-CTERM sorting domain-containing protein [Verrucomicrobiales bacterium]
MNFPFFSFPARLLSAALLCTAGGAAAATYSASWNTGFLNNGAVPDGSATGWSDSRSISIPADQTVTDVNVTVSLGGGWNGDLFAYLTHSSSPGVAVLLNRPGRTGANAFGFGDSLLTVTLDDGAANGDAHFYQSAVSYQTAISTNASFQPDGRAASPFTVNGTEPRTAMLSLFNGMNASSGNWTLFVADLSSGDVSTIANWGLSITTVPEPGAAGLLLLGGAAFFSRRRRQTPA